MNVGLGSFDNCGLPILKRGAEGFSIWEMQHIRGERLAACVYTYYSLGTQKSTLTKRSLR